MGPPAVRINDCTFTCAVGSFTKRCRFVAIPLLQKRLDNRNIVMVIRVGFILFALGRGYPR
jgi:hypothetical protein